MFRSPYTALATTAALFIAGCTTQPPGAHHTEMRSSEPAAQKALAVADTRLGTQWGESHVSHTRNVSGTRLSDKPFDLYTINYSAYPYRGEALTTALIADGRIRFSVLDGRGRTQSFVRNQSGDHLLGKEGERYQLHYENLSNSESYEVVAAVDGVDVINGKPASVQYRGYLLSPRATLTIEGFRESADSIAAFRFAKPDDAYAANSDKNSINNVGIIATAVYRVAIQGMPMPITVKPQPPRPNPFPADPPGQYAEPPRYDR
ncbi:hypothetical protein L0B52_06740 [Suttonella sp. R2A3]|uniref:hypothetical protein n=1 Tax=Suttonella sp. R2A3 TaxID=2908648 RepID=UPI001F2B488C|nr:hypothetical protein [Suttonella sp. R2A3]UJF24033.1 hypothetical protein L0B52_06740 [Suttonella sp. R2A3]